MAAKAPPQLSEADAKEILLAAFTKLKPYFEGGPDLEGKPLLELVEAVKEIADPTQKQQKLIAGCMPIIQKELGDELATKGFAPPMGVMMGMMQLKALSMKSALIKEAVDLVQAAMMQGELEALREKLPEMEAKLKA